VRGRSRASADESVGGPTGVFYFVWGDLRYAVGSVQRFLLVQLKRLGDLILTCSSSQSRNFSFGVAWGKGAPPDPATAPLAEGFFTAPALIEMAKAAGVEMPIASAVDDILARRAGIDEAIQALLMRPFRAET